MNETDRFHAELIMTIASSGLLPAAIGRDLSKATNESEETVEQRVNRTIKRLPLSVIQLIELLDFLGYRLKTEKK